MNTWRLSSRWSERGSYESTILDIFWKHGVVFIYDNNHGLENVACGDSDNEGDLIAVTDGHRIVGIAKPLTGVLGFEELKMGLRQSDLNRIRNAEKHIRGFRVRLLDVSGQKDLKHKTMTRFCCIRNTALKLRLKTLWEGANNEDTGSKFNIVASTKKLNELLDPKENKNIALYQIPIFQRPYAWGEEQIQRFLDDIEQGIEKDESMFIGTMQLSERRLLTPREEYYYQEVIDGQQRLTTCALVFKALQIIDPAMELPKYINRFSWIETRVSNGLQQQYFDDTLLNDYNEIISNSSDLNTYATNLKL